MIPSPTLLPTIDTSILRWLAYDAVPEHLAWQRQRLCRAFTRRHEASSDGIPTWRQLTRSIVQTIREVQDGRESIMAELTKRTSK